MSKDGRLVGAIAQAIVSMGFMLSPSAWGDVLEVTGNRAVETDVACTGVRFSGGDWTLSGPGKVIIADDGEGIVVAGGQATIACEVQVGATSGHAEQPINIASGASLTVAKDGGCISGAADLRADGAGEIVMNGVNTFDGKLSILAGRFTANNDAAFGSTVGGTYVRMLTAETVTDRTVTFGGIVTHENFEWQSRLNKEGMVVFPANATNEFYGNWTTLKTSAEDAPAGRNTMVYATYGQKSRTVYRGQIGWLQDCRCTSDATAVIEFLGSYSASVLECSAGTWHIGARLTTPMNVSNDTGSNGGLKIMSSSAHIVMEAENCFSPDPGNPSAYGAHMSSYRDGLLDLNGFSQHFAFLQGTWATVVTSAVPATVYVDLCKSPATTTEEAKSSGAVFRGNVSLVFAGTEKAQTLTGNSTATGCLSVKAGAVVTLSQTAKWGGAVALDGAGTTLTIQDYRALSPTSVVSVKGGARLNLDFTAEQMEISRLETGEGTHVQPGTYGAKGSGAVYELNELGGQGYLVIKPEVGREASFVGASGAGVASADSWSDGLKPTETGADTATFAANADRAILDADLSVRGVVFTRDFLLEDGGGTLTVGDAGVALDGGKAVSVTNEAPMRILFGQTWSLTRLGDVFVQEGALSSAAPGLCAAVVGKGDVHFRTPSPDFRGVLDFRSSSSAPGCVAHVWADGALGGETAKATFTRHASPSAATDHVVQFRPHGNIRLSNDMKFSGSAGKVPFVRYETDQRVEYAGRFEATAAVSDAADNASGTTEYFTGTEVVFSGGFDLAGGIAVTAKAMTFVMTNVPGRISSLVANNTWSFVQPARFELFTPTNLWDNASKGLDLTGCVEVNCHADEAIRYNSSKDCPRFYFAPGASQKLMPRIDLGGHDQSCASLCEHNFQVDGTYLTDDKFAIIESPTYVSSESPAQLVAHQSVDRTLRTFSWRDKAGLTLEGTGTLTLTNTASMTEGRLAVKGGKLVLGAGAAWPSVSEVAITDGGVLTLTGSGLVNRKANWYFGDGGKVTIPAGVTVKAKSLYLRDGTGKYKIQPGGTYTKANCSFVEGDGALVAGPLGLVISVR